MSAGLKMVLHHTFWCDLEANHTCDVITVTTEFMVVAEVVLKPTTRVLQQHVSWVPPYPIVGANHELCHTLLNELKGLGCHLTDTCTLYFVLSTKGTTAVGDMCEVVVAAGANHKLCHVLLNELKGIQAQLHLYWDLQPSLQRPTKRMQTLPAWQTVATC
jgi:hypothetical protein